MVCRRERIQPPGDLRSYAKLGCETDGELAYEMTTSIEAPLWRPAPDALARTQIGAFMRQATERYGVQAGNYAGVASLVSE